MSHERAFLPRDARPVRMATAAEVFPSAAEKEAEARDGREGRSPATAPTCRLVESVGWEGARAPQLPVAAAACVPPSFPPSRLGPSLLSFFLPCPPENVCGRSRISSHSLELLSAASAAKSWLGLRWQRAAARRGPEAPAPAEAPSGSLSPPGTWVRRFPRACLSFASVGCPPALCRRRRRRFVLKPSPALAAFPRGSSPPGVFFGSAVDFALSCQDGRQERVARLLDPP